MKYLLITLCTAEMESDSYTGTINTYPAGTECY